MSEIAREYTSPDSAIFSPEKGQEFGGSRSLFYRAALKFGVNLSRQEYNDWGALLGGAYVVDHLLDVEGRTEILPHVQSILAGKTRPDLNLEVQTSLKSYMDRQDPERKGAIFSDILRVEELAADLRNATTPTRLVEIRREEGDILGSLVALPVEETSDRSERLRFNRWLNSWSRTGYMMDSFVDLRKDYENGESGVKPTMIARGIVAEAVLYESAVAIQRTPPGVMRGALMNATRYLLMNRKHDIAVQPT